MKRFIALILGACLPLLAVIGVAVSQTTGGGFPSRPLFAHVTARGASPQIETRGTTTGNANQSFISFNDSAGTSKSQVGDTSNADSHLYVTNNTLSGEVRYINNTGTHRWSVDAGSTFPMTYNGTTFLVTAPTWQMKGAGAGAANTAVLRILDSGNVVIGTIGDTSGANSDIDIQAATVGANINLSPGATGGKVKIGGVNVCVANGTDCPTTGSAAPIFKVKAATTSRTSTAALADDPDLVTGALVANKHYRVEVCLLFREQTSGTGGFKFQMQVSSGAGSAVEQLQGNEKVNAATAQRFIDSTGVTVNYATVSTGVTPPDRVCVQGVHSQNGTTDGLNVQWAQNTSSANPTDLLLGSYMIVQQMD